MKCKNNFREAETLKDLNATGYRFVAVDLNGKFCACSGGIAVHRVKDAHGNPVIVYVFKEV